MRDGVMDGMMRSGRGDGFMRGMVSASGVEATCAWTHGRTSHFLHFYRSYLLFSNIGNTDFMPANFGKEGIDVINTLGCLVLGLEPCFFKGWQRCVFHDRNRTRVAREKHKLYHMECEFLNLTFHWHNLKFLATLTFSIKNHPTCQRNPTYSKTFSYSRGF